MIEGFILVFGVCLLINHIREGKSFILLTQLVTIANSIREKSPRNASDKGKNLNVEYKYGNRIYCILIPKRRPIPWTHAGVFKAGQWVNKTSKIKYYSGPFRDFHGFPITPANISQKYEKISFIMDDKSRIQVMPNENIAEKLKTEHIRIIKENLAKKETIIIKPDTETIKSDTKEVEPLLF
jgi:hypothetical protein